MTQIYAIVQWFSDSKLFKTMVSGTKQTLEGVQTEDFSNLGLPGERRLGAQRNHQMLPALRSSQEIISETQSQWRDNDAVTPLGLAMNQAPQDHGTLTGRRKDMKG